MNRTVLALALGGAAMLSFAPEAEAQGVALAARVGAHVPAGDITELRAEARELRVEREAGFSLGLTLELGSLRGSVDYVTGKTITEEGLDEGELGDGSLLAVAGGVVLRPFPRLLGASPYLLAGAGLKRDGYSYNEDGLDDLLPESETTFALQAGLGLDVTLGRIGALLEIADYISWDDGAGRHDAFITVGARLQLF